MNVPAMCRKIWVCKSMKSDWMHAFHKYFFEDNLESLVLCFFFTNKSYEKNEKAKTNSISIAK